jgi:hypothetical protein
MAKGQEFERMVKKSFDNYLERNRLVGRATRIPQVKYNKQGLGLNVDLIVEFKNSNYRNLGIECKTHDFDCSSNKDKCLKINSIYSLKQFIDEINYLKDTNKTGLIFFELKHNKEKHYFMCNIKEYKMLKKVGISIKNMYDIEKLKPLYLTKIRLNGSNHKILNIKNETLKEVFRG